MIIPRDFQGSPDSDGIFSADVCNILTGSTMHPVCNASSAKVESPCASATGSNLDVRQEGKAASKLEHHRASHEFAHAIFRIDQLCYCAVGWFYMFYTMQRLNDDD
jgi:hypothetical protein